MLQQWRQGYQVVYAVRRSRRGESWLKRFTANGFYWLIDQLSQVRIPRNTGDFRLLDRQVVEAVKQLRERTRFMKGIFAWVGYRQTAIFYDRAPPLSRQNPVELLAAVEPSHRRHHLF
jgi:glycosyltransferase involved in cell wall biosynthesis